MSERWRCAQALRYWDAARNHVFPFHLPDTKAAEAWTRAYFWHPSTFYASQFTAAVHQDLVERKVSRCNSPAVMVSLGKCLEALRQEIAKPSPRFEMTLVTVGLLSTHNLNEERMKAMHYSAPLCFDPVFDAPLEWRVIQQLEPDPSHISMMCWLVHKLGGIENVHMPGLAETCAYVELQHASKYAQHPRIESLWENDGAWLSSLPDQPANSGEEESTRAKAGSGFFVSALMGLTSRALAVLMQLSAMNEAMQLLAATSGLSTSTAFHLGSIRPARNSIQHELVSLPTWEELPSDEQKRADETIYKACTLAAIIYSNAALFAIPYHSGWHTSLALKLQEVIQGAKWPAATHDVQLWVLLIGGIAAAQSASRAYYEDELELLLYTTGRPTWEGAERILRRFLWSTKACRQGAASLWQTH